MVGYLKAGGILLGLAGAMMALLPSYQPPHYAVVNKVHTVRIDFSAIEARPLHHGGALYEVKKVVSPEIFDGREVGQTLLVLEIHRRDETWDACEAFGAASANYKTGDHVRVYQVTGGSTHHDATAKCNFATPPIRE